MGYKVKLETFEGPFDLLVYLIESARMSIYDIRVSEITEQYIEYLDQMQQMDVAVSSEFMVLAAELIELKSKMLLPRKPVEKGAPAEEDPRADLVARILEYKKYKYIAQGLAEREERARLIGEKPQEDISVYLQDPDEILVTDMDKFVNAFNAFLNRKKKLEEIRTRYERIEREKYTAEQRAAFITDLFRKDPDRRINFTDTLIGEKDNYDRAVSFSTMLDMIRHGRLTAEQKSLFADIYLQATGHTFDESGGEETPGSDTGERTE